MRNGLPAVHYLGAAAEAAPSLGSWRGSSLRRDGRFSTFNCDTDMFFFPICLGCFWMFKDQTDTNKNVLHSSFSSMWDGVKGKKPNAEWKSWDCQLSRQNEQNASVNCDTFNFWCSHCAMFFQMTMLLWNQCHNMLLLFLTPPLRNSVGQKVYYGEFQFIFSSLVSLKVSELTPTLTESTVNADQFNVEHLRNEPSLI